MKLLFHFRFGDKHSIVFMPKTYTRRFSDRLYMFNIFELPPVSQRHMIGGPVKGIFYPPSFTAAADDTYIHYLIMRNSFVVSVIFAAVYFIAAALNTTFNFYFFSINGSGPDFFSNMIFSYPFVVPTILLLIFVPYGWHSCAITLISTALIFFTGIK